MYSLYKGGPENFGKSRMQEKPSTTFLGLFFIFLFSLISFLYFFSAIL